MTPEEPIVDQAFLDEAYEAAVALVEDGAEVDIETLLGNRPHLRAEVEKLVDLAYDLVSAGRARLPALPGYELLGEIGRGGMGSVHLARQLSLDGRLVALKLLPVFAGITSSARSRFLAEIRALAALRHANIVTIYDVIAEGPLVAYTMEWVEGPSLSALIAHVGEGVPGDAWRRTRELLPEMERAGSFPSYIARLGEDVARALAAVHAQDLLHRDVKPSNILIRRDGTPLLADFGLVRDEDGSLHTQTGAFVGTPAYAPPEQLRGAAAELGPRSDVYSLGASLHHALAGVPPFAGRDAHSVLRAVEAGRLPRLRGIDSTLPRDLETIVATALEDDPERRYDGAEALAEDLRRLRELRSIQARPAGVARRSLKFLRRHRPSVLGGAAGAVATAVAVALLFVWFVWLPGKIDEAHRIAREALLDPGFSELIALRTETARYADSLDEAKLPYGRSQSAPDLKRARARFSEALRWSRGRALPVLRAEAAVVEIASAYRGELLASLDRANPRVSAAPDLVWLVVDRVAAEGAFPPAASIDWDRRSDLDNRAAGLLGFLCEDLATAEAAWEELDTIGGSYPLADAALGQIRLRQDRPGAAALRLRQSLNTFPDAGFLASDIAEIAFDVGEFKMAERQLERSASMSVPNPFQGADLLEARIAAAQGRHVEARAMFAVLVNEFRYRKLRVAYVDYLGSLGLWSSLLWVTLADAFQYPERLDYHQRFIEAYAIWFFLDRGWLSIGTWSKPPLEFKNGQGLAALLRQLEQSAAAVIAAAKDT